MIDGLVSVITPMYNAEKWIRDTISSVLLQTYEHWEMIVVDDCSTDNSAVIVQEMMRLDARIKYYRNEKNSGVVVTRNNAIKFAEGQYIAFLDSDDIWCPEKLAKQIEKMQKENIAFCYSACEVIDEKGNSEKKIRYVPESIDYKELLKGNEIPCLTVVIDRKVVFKIEMPQIHHEDYATWLGILKNGITAYGISEVLAQYRVVSHSLSGNKIRAMSWTWSIYREYLKLNIFKSCYYFGWYLIKAVRKRSKVLR